MVIVKGELLYEGKTKQVYTTSAPDFYWLYYQDTPAGVATPTGVLHNLLAENWFLLLRQQGIDNHMIAALSPREMMVKRLEMIPLTVLVRNIVDGTLAQQLGLKAGTSLPQPVVELYYQHDGLDEPLVNPYHLQRLGMATHAEIKAMQAQALRVNQVLQADLASRGIDLVDIRLEFGRYQDELLLGDEISLNTCRLRDAETNVAIEFKETEATWQEFYRRLTGSDPILD